MQPGERRDAACRRHGRRALPLHLRDEACDVTGQLLVARGPGRGDGRADATGGVRRAGHPGGELLHHRRRVRRPAVRDDVDLELDLGLPEEGGQDAAEGGVVPGGGDHDRDPPPPLHHGLFG